MLRVECRYGTGKCDVRKSTALWKAKLSSDLCINIRIRLYISVGMQGTFFFVCQFVSTLLTDPSLSSVLSVIHIE